MSVISRLSHSQGGVVLLEVLAAVLVFSVGILAVVGLQATSVAAVSDAKYRIDAAAMADRVIGQMWVDQSHWALYTGTTNISTELPGGSMTVTAVGSNVSVTVSWTLPRDAVTHTFSTMALIYPT